MKNKAYLECKSREQAVNIWLDKLAQSGCFDNLPQEEIPVSEAVGRVAAHSAYARRSVPHYNSAAMDGIAVSAKDTYDAGDRSPKHLKVLAEGTAFVPGCCYLINTGNVMPPGTDAVIMIEHTYLTDGMAEILAPAVPWQHVRIIGEDIVEHELVLPEYDVITPAGIGSLLAAGIETIRVIARPAVSILATGNEIVSAGQQLGPGKILDINSHMLKASITQLGGQAQRIGMVADGFQVIKQAVVKALADSDIVVVVAGTSAGTKDYTCEALAALGEIVIHGVAIKPGKPVILALCQGKPVIGLPGYPVSALLAFELFVKPVVERRQKLPGNPQPLIDGCLARQIPSEIGVEEYIRVSIGRVDDKRIVVPMARGAGLISSLTKAQGILKIEAGSAGLPSGTKVTVRLLNAQLERQASLLAIGSHDLSLDILGLHLRRRAKVLLSCASVGSTGGVMAIRNGEAQLAGIHILDENTGEYNIAYLEKHLAGKSYSVVHLARREQGLMVQKNNPRNIRSD